MSCVSRTVCSEHHIKGEGCVQLLVVVFKLVYPVKEEDTVNLGIWSSSRLSRPMGM